MAVNTKTFSVKLNYFEDEELIELLEGLRNRNLFFKTLLRNYISANSDDDDGEEENEMLQTLYQNSLENREIIGLMQENLVTLTSILKNGATVVAPATPIVGDTPKINFHNEVSTTIEEETDEEEIERQRKLKEDRKKRRAKMVSDGW